MHLEALYFVCGRPYHSAECDSPNNNEEVDENQWDCPANQSDTQSIPTKQMCLSSVPLINVRTELIRLIILDLTLALSCIVPPKPGSFCVEPHPTVAHCQSLKYAMRGAC